MDTRRRHRFYIAMMVGGVLVMIGSAAEFVEGGAIQIVLGVLLFVGGACNTAFGALQLRADR